MITNKKYVYDISVLKTKWYHVFLIFYQIIILYKAHHQVSSRKQDHVDISFNSRRYLPTCSFVKGFIQLFLSRMHCIDGGKERLTEIFIFKLFLNSRKISFLFTIHA